MKHEDGFEPRRHGASAYDGGASEDRGAAPGKRTGTERLPAADPITKALREVEGVERGLAAIHERELPALTAAIAARSMQEARAASGVVAAELLRVERQVAALRRWAVVSGSDGMLAMLAPLEAAFGQLRAQAAPALALAPPPASPISVGEALCPWTVSPDAWAAREASESAAQAAWEAQVEAATAGVTSGQVIDASDRFGPVEGRPLPAAARGRLEAAAGTDLGGVRLHDGAAANDLAASYGARAVTIGQDIHFAEDELDVNSEDGERLLAHEVAHTLQQRSRAASPARKALAATSESSASELEADRFAHAVVGGRRAAPIENTAGEAAALKKRGATSGADLDREPAPLVVEPGQITFPRTALGTESAAQTVMVGNAGSSPVNIEDVAISSSKLAGVFPTYAQTINDPIEAGAWVPIQFAFRPAAEGPQSASYNIITDGGVRSGGVQLEGAAFSNDRSEVPVVSASEKVLKFQSTEVNNESPVVTVELKNHGDQPVTIEAVDIKPRKKGRHPTAKTEFAASNAAGAVLPPGASAEIAVSFKPAHKGLRLASLVIEGNQGAKLATVKLRGKCVTAETARLQGALRGEVGPVATFDDMLTALRVARTFTDKGDDESYGHGHDVLDPVVSRLDELAPRMEKILRDYGAANVAGLTMFGEAHWAVKEWWLKLAIGSTINADYYLDVFRAAEDEIKLGTGEIEESASLRALQDAGETTAIVVAVAALSLPVVAAIVAEAPLLYASAQYVSAYVTTWALANPAPAVALAEILANQGIVIGEGGWEAFADQFNSWEGFAMFLLGLWGDAVQLQSAADDGVPTPRRRSDGADDVEPPTPKSKTPADATSKKQDGAAELTPEEAEQVAKTVAKAKKVIEEVEAAVDGGADNRRSSPPHPQGRVSDPVEGLYDSIAPDLQPPGWKFTDVGPAPNKEYPHLMQIETKVVAPDGTTGRIERSYDPKKKQLVMENAFLDKLPSWIDAGVPLRADKGTPTVAYLTMRQMKLFDIQYGHVSEVKMSSIQNVKAVMQLERRLRDGESLDAAVAQTHSVEYASTSIQQSGQEIVDIRIETTKAWRWELEAMMDHFDVSPKERAKLFDAYELKPSDEVLVNYDIFISVVPHPKNAK